MGHGPSILACILARISVLCLIIFLVKDEAVYLHCIHAVACQAQWAHYPHTGITAFSALCLVPVLWSPLPEGKWFPLPINIPLFIFFVGLDIKVRLVKHLFTDPAGVYLANAYKVLMSKEQDGKASM